MTVQEPSLVSGANASGEPSLGTHPTLCPSSPMENPVPEPHTWSGGVSLLPVAC